MGAREVEMGARAAETVSSEVKFEGSINRGEGRRHCCEESRKIGRGKQKSGQGR
jgi:hypothetical protein